MRPLSFNSPPSDQPFSVIITAGLLYVRLIHLHMIETKVSLLNRLDNSGLYYLKMSAMPVGTEYSQCDSALSHVESILVCSI